MGWKVALHLDQAWFKEKYDKGEAWGDLSPFKVTLTDTATQEIYGQGYMSGSPTGVLLSAKLQHYPGMKTRVTLKYMVGFKAGATGEVSCGLVFYKDTESCKDGEGYDYHGVAHGLTEAQANDIAESYELVVEQENNVIKLYVEGTKLAEFQLEPPLNTFKVGGIISQVSGAEAFFVIYEVKLEYYDWMEDMALQMLNFMVTMIGFLLIMMVFGVMVKGMRKAKEGGKEAGG